MSGRIRIITAVIFLLVLITVNVNAQLLQDTTVLSLVRKDVNHIYNMEFDAARADYATIVRSYPGQIGRAHV
jgi:hypothetical protein